MQLGRSQQGAKWSSFRARRYGPRPQSSRTLSRSPRMHFERLEPRLALASVMINEILAVNDKGITDQDGDRSDWIELKNSDTVPVNIGGWYLADSAAQWQFPDVTLAPGEHLLVFASGKNRAVAGQQLHTSFQLSADGEPLKLLMPDGTTVVHAFDPYPAQLADVSYGLTSLTTTTDMLIDEGASVRALVPTSASAIDTTWYTLGFDDSTWTEGTAGVGFDNDTDGIDLETYVGLNLEAAMDQQFNTAYLRFPFMVADPSAYLNLKLRIRYEDGFVAYLNGNRMSNAALSAPASPTWNSAATASRSPQSAAQTYLDIDLTAFRHLLVPGANVLAIHGLNRNTTSRDFLIDPLLVADRADPPVVAYMVTPTPGASNVQGTLGFVADTKFSVDRGFYTNPFQVLITTATPGATIRYTLNGSPPTATSGLVYDPLNPPLISTTTTLRAAAYKTGHEPTNIDTQTYIFLDDVIHQNGAGLPPYAPWSHFGSADWEVDPNIVNNPLYANTIKDDLQSVATVSLVLPWNDWFGANGQGIYISGSSIERLGSFELFSADGAENYESVAIMEIQGGGIGGTSADRWKSDKLSMQVTFKPPAPSRLDAPLFTNPMFDQGAGTKFDTFILDAVLNFSWTHGTDANQRNNAKFIQDQVVADLHNLMGGQSPHGRYVHLYLNGLYWGMYYLHERPDERFAETYLGGDKEDYDILRHNGTTPVNGDTTAPVNYAAMLNAVRQDMLVPNNYAAVEQWLDIDDFIDYMLVNFYAGNTDWAQKNWYASYNRVDSTGRWRFHSWDAEHTFKGLTDNVTSANNGGAPTEIHQRLVVNPEYRLRFADHVQKHFQNGGALTPAVAGAVYAARATQIDRAVVGESARWGDNRREPAYTRADWRATQDSLLANYFPGRTAQVLGQVSSKGWLMPLAAPLFSKFGGTISPGFQLTLNKPGGSPAAAQLYYTLDGSDPRDANTKLPSASAILYGGPITLNSGARVKARIFNASNAGTDTDWSAIVDATFLQETPFPVRISEIHYNPAPHAGVADEQDLEFIELLNTGSQTVSLAGVTISQFASVPYVFGAGQSLEPGERIVVSRSPTIAQAIYGPSVNVAAAGFAPANLSNGGERIVLSGPLGEVLQDFEYSDLPPWPTKADGEGWSLEIIDPLADPSDPANWRASATVGGSPGSAGGRLAGDYDGNAVVDVVDLTAWRALFGVSVAPGTAADGNGDGVVDAADYLVWRTAFNNSAASAQAVSAQPVDAIEREASPAVVFQIAAEPLTLPRADRAEVRPTARSAMTIASDAGINRRVNLLAGKLNRANREAAWADVDLPTLAAVRRLNFADEQETTAETDHPLSALSQIWENDSWLRRLGDTSLEPSS